MAAPRKPNPKALRRRIPDWPLLPDDPWQAPWERREPGPTQLADLERWWRRRRRRSSPAPRTPPAAEDDA